MAAHDLSHFFLNMRDFPDHEIEYTEYIDVSYNCFKM